MGYWLVSERPYIISIYQANQHYTSAATGSHLPELKPHQGHVQALTGALRFATVSGLNDMFPGNGVHRYATGFEIRFLLFVGVSKTSAQSAATCTVYKPCGIKETAHTMSPSESFTMCPLQLGTHNSWRYVCRKSFYRNIANQRDDDTFLSKGNWHQNKWIELVYCFHMFIYIKGKIAEIIRAQL